MDLKKYLLGYTELALAQIIIGANIVIAKVLLPHISLAVIAFILCSTSVAYCGAGVFALEDENGAVGHH